MAAVDNDKAGTEALRERLGSHAPLVVMPTPLHTSKSGPRLDSESFVAAVGGHLRRHPSVPLLLFGHSGRMHDISLEQRLAVLRDLAAAAPSAGLPWLVGARSSDEAARLALAAKLNLAGKLACRWGVMLDVPLPHGAAALLDSSAPVLLRRIDPSVRLTWPAERMDSLVAVKDDSGAPAQGPVGAAVALILGRWRFANGQFPASASSIASSYAFLCPRSLVVRDGGFARGLAAVLARLDVLRSKQGLLVTEELWRRHFLGRFSIGLERGLSADLAELYDAVMSVEDAAS